LKVGEWSILWGAFRAGIGNDFRIAFRMGTAINADLIWDAPVTLSTWYFVSVTYDLATSTATLSVNGGERVARTVATMPSAVYSGVDGGLLKISQQHGSAAVNGSYAKHAIWTRTISRAEELELYNSGFGKRYDVVPNSLKTGMLSWWEMNEAPSSAAAATFVDRRAVANFTISTFREPPIAADPVVNALAPAGADIALKFKRGEKYVGGLSVQRPGCVVTDYGTGNKPVLTMFDVVISNVWTLVSGTTYKIALATKPGWVKKLGDDYLPFDLILAKAADGADCQATADSFWYDGGNSELHLNVGADPATVSPTGWEGTTAQEVNGLQAYVFSSNFQRAENVIFLGSGISEPGATSGYGLQILGTANQEFVGKNLDVFYTGYHAIGQITDNGITTLEGCKAGLCCNRNQEATTDEAANGTIYVAFDGSGGNEWIMWDCEVNHGTLPSYDWTTNAGMGGFIAHGSTLADRPALCLSYGTIYRNSDHLCGYGTASSGIEAADWGDLRSWIVNEVLESNYPSTFGIVSSTNTDVACVNSSISTARAFAEGYLLGGSNYWLVNCTMNADLASSASGYNIISNIPVSGSIVRMINCRIDVANHNGVITFATESNPLTLECENTIISRTGTGSLVLGTNVAAGDFTNCAWFGATAVGTGAVTLTANPSLTTFPNAQSQLYNNGLPGLVEYDRNDASRPTIPTIGPIEAANA
jgi:hypothetical protein